MRTWKRLPASTPSRMYVLLASLASLVGCKNEWTAPLSVISAVVFGAATDPLASVAGRTVSVRALSIGCDGPAIGDGAGLVRADGTFRVAVIAAGATARNLCVVLAFPSASGSDSVFKTAQVAFRSSSPADSVRVDVSR